jgi:hypothetical protein
LQRYPGEFGSNGADSSLGEQLGAGVGELDVGPGFVSPQPALRDRAPDAGAVFGRTAAGSEKGAIDPLDIDAGVLDGFCGVGDLNQFRTAASRSLNGLCSAKFTGFVLGRDVRDMNQGVL